MALLEVEDLTVNFYTEEGVVTAVDGLSYSVAAGEKFGVVGESGAGKSVTALSVMDLIEDPGRIESGTVRFKGRDLRSMADREVRTVRGNEIAMIFQDAGTALNPVYTVGEQIAEAIRHHLDYDERAARERTIRLLDEVGIPDPATRYSDYPHEFSGGMQQRVVVAMALSCDPDLLIADEPTTALDVTTEAKILERIESLAEEFDTAVQLITHDLGVIAEVCDRVMVMYAGEPVEKASVEELYYDPQHPYTVGLMSSIPRLGDRRQDLQPIPGTMPDLVDVPSGCRFHPRCPYAEEVCAHTRPGLVDPATGEPAREGRGAACLAHTGDLDGDLDYRVEVRDRVPEPTSREGEPGPTSREGEPGPTSREGEPGPTSREGTGTAVPRSGDGEPVLRAENLTKHYDSGSGVLDSLLGRGGTVRAVDGVDLELHEGETLGVVGESGCGKTTLARSLLRLVEPTDGTVHYRGEDLTAASDARLRSLRKDVQYIFQDPFASLNPRQTVGDIVGEPLDVHGLASGEKRAARVDELLETVGLNPRHAGRYPHEFSGGQRQRIGIARALAVDPEVIVCDEPVSALDVSVQAQILNLLADLQAEFGLSYVLIAHDLSVVEHLSDRIAVMYLGEFVERGTTEEVFSPPFHPYTDALISAVPEPDPEWEGDRVLLSGQVPSPADPPDGCRFHTRCPEVIQPEAYGMEQSAWRGVLDLKLRLGEVDGLAALLGASDDPPGDRSRAELGARVRSEFDIPEQLSDGDAEAALASALDRLHDAGVAAAREAVAEAFESPCERTDPGAIRTDGTHDVACLLYEDGSPDRRPRAARRDRTAGDGAGGGTDGDTETGADGGDGTGGGTDGDTGVAAEERTD
jgi:peptide/nickel transport system ATP-binding protein